MQGSRKKRSLGALLGEESVRKVSARLTMQDAAVLSMLAQRNSADLSDTLRSGIYALLFLDTHADKIPEWTAFIRSTAGRGGHADDGGRPDGPSEQPAVTVCPA